MNDALRFLTAAAMLGGGVATQHYTVEQYPPQPAGTEVIESPIVQDDLQALRLELQKMVDSKGWPGLEKASDLALADVPTAAAGSDPGKEAGGAVCPCGCGIDGCQCQATVSASYGSAGGYGIRSAPVSGWRYTRQAASYGSNGGYGTNYGSGGGYSAAPVRRVVAAQPVRRFAARQPVRRFLGRCVNGRCE